ncbi:chorismate--pyruvate lyase family protein [Pleionea sediminis]|uniref:chorismate--pyruvate lyase family protein n=1 Tax=Pleionea sediminis TaxID=2569479 RepID=UPI001185B04B|nr:chorismate lyase [Pleionea sediminis]
MWRFRIQFGGQCLRGVEGLKAGTGQDWLTFRGSLTEKMEQVSGSPMSVKILNQGMLPIYSEERAFLNLSERQWGWVREVELSFDGVPWVLARTVIPQKSLVKNIRRITLLRDKPLGPLLFHRLNAQRCEIDFERVNSTSWTHHIAQNLLWCRRSTFLIQQKILLLRELFLPSHPVYGNE